MAIQIPADLATVTLRNQGRELSQRWTEAHAKSVFNQASNLLQVRAGIKFTLHSCEQIVEQMPAGMRADVVDDAGYHFLAAAHHAGIGVRVLLVDKVSRPELGGEARSQTRICLIAFGQDAASTGRMLAHEFGHLLGLPHVDGSRRAGPGQEREIAAWMRNLMYSGALNPAAELTPAQVREAGSSALARRFGGS